MKNWWTELGFVPCEDDGELIVDESEYEDDEDEYAWLNDLED